MLVDSKEELVDNVLANAVSLLRSVEFELGQKNMVKMWRVLGALSDIQNDRYDTKYASVNKLVDELTK
jgi:hypothetical protein